MQLNNSHPLSSNLISLIGVDESNVLVDLIAPSRTFTLASGSSFGSGQWGRHFATSNASSPTFKGFISDTDISTGAATELTLLLVLHDYAGVWSPGGGGFLVGPNGTDSNIMRAGGFAWDETAQRVALFGYSSTAGVLNYLPFPALTSGANASPIMLAGTINPSTNTSKAYLNGALQNTGPSVSSGTTAAVHKRFFGVPSYATNSGKLVWYALFNKALTDQEITDLYASLGANNTFALVESGGAGDTTAPTLTSPTASATGATTASGSVSTNEANGTLYYRASANATELAATVKAGSSKAVTAAGAQSINLTGLMASTSYYLHFVHTDAAGNDSAVSTTSQFTTTAVATKTLRINETLYVDSAKTATYAGNVAVTVLSRAATRAIVHQANSVAITAGVLPGITGASFDTTGEAFDVVLVASDTVRGVYPATVTES